MELVAFSDLHAHEYQSHARALEGGMNSRLLDCLNAARQVLDYAARKAAPVIFGGDAFVIKGSVPVMAFNSAHDLLLETIGEGSRENSILLGIPGNHDMANEDGSQHALKSMRIPGVQFFDEPRVHFFDDSGGVAVAFVPFPMKYGKFNREKFFVGLKTVEEWVKKIPCSRRILVSHLYTHDLMKRHHDLDGDCWASELVDVFDLVLLGHHHIHDVVNLEGRKVVSIGAPLQHNFNDRGQDRGFISVDTDTLEIIFHEIESPKFIAFEGEKSIPYDEIKKGDIIRLRVSSNAEAARAKEKLGKLGVEVVPELVPVAKESRIDLSPGAKDDEIIDKFLDSEWADTKLDKARLARIGKAYLKAA